MNQQQRPDRHDLNDAEYALLEPLLPPERPHKRGHPWTSHRQAINGIL